MPNLRKCSHPKINVSGNVQLFCCYLKSKGANPANLHATRVPCEKEDMDMFSSHTVAGLNIWQINYQFCHLTVLRKYHHGVILICLDSDFYQITKYIIVCFFYKDKNYLIKIIFSPWNIILKNKLKIGWRKMKLIVINIFRIISYI